MLFIKIIFWFFLAIVFYSYIGYGVIIYIYLKLKSAFGKNNKFQFDPHYIPDVTLVTALFNEETVVEAKILDTFKIDYPEGKLKIIFITDGSSDSTPDIVSKYPRVQLLHQPQREGKVAAINRAMQFVTTPLVIFCDANTYLNRDCVKNIVRHYIDPKVAAVSGEKKIANINTHEYAASAGEGLYWKYESFLKTLDSRFYTVVGAAGELFSVRTSLFQPVDKRILLDDFYISMKLCEQGYRVVYEPEAYSTEAPSFSIKDEQIRKVRNGAGGIQAILLLLPLLNIFKYGKLSFQYISHRVLRWIICPPILPLILILNVIIWYFSRETAYSVILIAQIAFYLAAFSGWLFTLKNIKVKFLYVPYYFVFINVAMYLGFIRFIKKTQSVLWEKAKRA